MGTEKIDRRSVCTVALSVLLSLLLALTPVLAVAEPANGGSASADAAEATPGDSESSETSGDASVDATKTTPPQSDRRYGNRSGGIRPVCLRRCCDDCARIDKSGDRPRNANVDKHDVS